MIKDTRYIRPNIDPAFILKEPQENTVSELKNILYQTRHLHVQEYKDLQRQIFNIENELNKLRLKNVEQSKNTSDTCSYIPTYKELSTTMDIHGYYSPLGLKIDSETGMWKWSNVDLVLPNKKIYQLAILDILKRRINENESTLFNVTWFAAAVSTSLLFLLVDSLVIVPFVLGILLNMRFSYNLCKYYFLRLIWRI